MKINNLTLYKYKRMSNLPYNKFEFKPKSKINIILGSNGMGKSSLLKELLPNAEDTKKEYEEDGYKILNFEHNSRLYTISYYRNENKYSFIVDEEELNPSYNMKTFKRLIEEHFNLSKDVFNLLIGLDNFTTMSPTERKKWFTEILSETDYEYGLLIYNRAKTRYRELTGMLKMIESKLLKEHTELKNTITDKNKVKDEISYLTEVKNNITNNLSKPNPVPNKYRELVESINEYNKLSDLEIDENMDEKLAELKIKIETLNQKIDSYNEQLINIENILNKNDKLIELEKELITIKSKIKDKIDRTLTIQEYLDVINYIDDNFIKLTDLFNSLREYKSKYSIKDNELLLKKLENSKDELENINKQIYKTESMLKELENKKHKEFVCPKCGNVFNPDFDQKHYDTLLKELEKLYKTKDNYLKEIKNLEKEIETLQNRKLTLLELRSIVNGSISFRKLFKHIVNDRSLEKENESIFNELKMKYYELKDKEETLKLLKRKEDIENDISFIKDIKKQDLNKLEKMLEDVSNKRIKEIELLESVNKEYNRLKNIKAKMDKKIELGKKITTLLKDMHYYKMYRYNELVYKFNLNVIDLINEMLAELKDRLTDIEIRENRIKELENDKKELTERKKAVNKIIEALSPNKGLLAKGLITFINNVIEDMNTVISNIFDYDLYIKPIDLEDGKLDFNFKLISKGNEISDISKGSSGMREVIDLAFKLVAMKILDMEDYPLILDEFGRALDNVHRGNAYEYINEISNEMFSQIFIVTHNEDVFSRFPNANIVLLDKEHYNIKDI